MITERVVLFEDGVEGNGDVYPLGISRQKWRNDFMVTFATREQLSPFDDIILGMSLKGFTMCFDSLTCTKPTGAAMIPAG